MQILGPKSVGTSGNRPAFALGIDTSHLVTKLSTVKEAHLLPAGSVVGDQHGGLTFTDHVAAVLENRSMGGWREIKTPSGEIWTLIVLDR
jgi:hypothetical protein